jgi:hypothetical protein
MNQAVYEKLKEVARAGKTITYNKIGKSIDLDLDNEEDRRKLSDILGEISEKEFEQGRPLLSAVVVSYRYQLPGQGFFEMAHRLRLQEFYDNEIFHREELKRVHDYWKKDKK